MTTDQIGGLVRTLLAVTMPLVVAHHFLDGATAEWISGGVTAAVIGAWSWWTNRPAKVIPTALLK